MSLIGEVEVGRMGFGCFALSGGYGAADQYIGETTIHAALDMGVVLLDTSDAYAAGANEELVGRALKGRRNTAAVATKFGWVLNESGQPTRLDSSPAHVREACHQSLRRLRTEHIDLYQQHRVDPETPIEETVGELVRLRDEGKIRAFGLSEAGVQTIRRAHSRSPVSSLQTEYSLWSRDAEDAVLPLCSELGILFIAYSPLGRGFLSGAVRHSSDLESTDFRLTHPRFQQQHIDRNLVLVDWLTKLALEVGCTTSQLALAWLLAQPWKVIPIPATRSVKHLHENVTALDIGLTPDQVDAISARFSPDSISGPRHPAEHMKTIGR